MPLPLPSTLPPSLLASFLQSSFPPLLAPLFQHLNLPLPTSSILARSENLKVNVIKYENETDSNACFIYIQSLILHHKVSSSFIDLVLKSLPSKIDTRSYYALLRGLKLPSDIDIEEETGEKTDDIRSYVYSLKGLKGLREELGEDIGEEEKKEVEMQTVDDWEEEEEDEEDEDYNSEVDYSDSESDFEVVNKSSDTPLPTKGFKEKVMKWFKRRRDVIFWFTFFGVLAIIKRRRRLKR